MRRKTGSDPGMTLIDSSGWVGYFSGGPRAARFAKYISKCRPETSITPTIVLYEVYRRILASFSPPEALEAMAMIREHTRCVDLTPELALTAAATGREEGLALADSIILTCARIEGATIITGDSDFEGLAEAIVIK